MGTLYAPVSKQNDDVICIFDQAESAERAEVFIKNPFVAPRSVSHLLTMIVCGNCSGEGQVPRKTLLAADSTCVMCGGRSYVLASKLQIPRKGKEPYGCE
jgi:hypothetical protein